MRAQPAQRPSYGKKIPNSFMVCRLNRSYIEYNTTLIYSQNCLRHSVPAKPVGKLAHRSCDFIMVIRVEEKILKV